MGVRFTGINTPFFGANWEYTKSERTNEIFRQLPDKKLKVFISSICGEEKYDRVRHELKRAIEDTNLAEVYTFEETGASTLSAEEHYIWELKDSDICIFLIDNKDGVRSGVQKEIDIAKKYNIKSLYYFCDEHTKEKTVLEQSITGAKFAKSKTVHKFENLSKNGAKDLVSDIVRIYHNYCVGRLNSIQEETGEIQEVDIDATEIYQKPIIPKTALKDMDESKNYILKFALGYSFSNSFQEQKESGVLDKWCKQFLEVLFEGLSIRQFNTAMYLDDIEEYQEKTYFEIVKTRWKAIQAYFAGDIEMCVKHLREALERAKETNQATWIIKDILIDMRNQEWSCGILKHQLTESQAQKELDESEEELYYPLLDRIQVSLNQTYIDGLYKEKTESPYTVSFGSNIGSISEMLAGRLVVAMYNGSLTQILSFYKKMQDFLFYLCCRYNNWELRRGLYCLVLFSGEEKEIKNIQNTYPEILNKLNSEEASMMMKFCQSQPVKYRRINNLLTAFGQVGYYLDDTEFEKYEKIIVKNILTWLEDKKVPVVEGQNIFKCLLGVCYRMSQDTIAEICCKFLEKKYTGWYRELFLFLAEGISLEKMSHNVAEKLIGRIEKVLEDEKEFQEIKSNPRFLHVLRKQDKKLTEKLDEKVKEYLPEYYDSTYLLETTQDEERDFPIFLKKYTESIRKQNEEQGKNGVYHGYATRSILTVKNILIANKINYGADIMDNLIETIVFTLLKSKESIRIKLDAIEFLTCVVIKYPEDYKRNRNLYEKIYEYRENISANSDRMMDANINIISLKIGLQFLYTAMGKDTYEEILELMPYLYNDIPTTISVSRVILTYLNSSKTVCLPEKVEGIVIQQVLQWCKLEYTDIRWNAVGILMLLGRNPLNRRTINNQIITLIDSDNVYIKNLIMNSLSDTAGIAEKTRVYVTEKCRNDYNYVVRMVCRNCISGE